MERYELTEKICEGGFSVVYKVKDRNIGSIFVAKEIKEREIAEKEIQWLRILKHPGLPGLHDVVHTETSTYIIMEYIGGVTLREFIKTNGAMKDKECVKWMVKLTELLLFLHAQNTPVIHGDLKPENIILRETGELALLDLGSAAYLGDLGNALYGTKGYVAPERLDGKSMVQNDIYSAGKLMQYMITGCEPAFLLSYTAEEIVKYFGITDALAKILINATNPDPEKRYASANIFLQAFLEPNGRVISAKRKNTGVWFFLAGVFLMIGFLLYMSDVSYANCLFGGAAGLLFVVGLLVRKAEKEENVIILKCEYSLLMSE